MTLVKPLNERFHFVRQLRSTKGSIVWLAKDAKTKKIVVVSTVSNARVEGLQRCLGIRHLYLSPLIEVFDGIQPALIPGPTRPKGPVAVAVAEHVDGKTLHDRLTEKPIPVEKTISWMLAVTQAVRALHGAGAVHGAISPRAIIVSRSDGGPTPTLTNLRIPANGSYCSPDRVMGKGPSTRDDVWALYAMLFTCLAREVPFSGTTRTELARRIVHGKYKKLSTVLDEPELDAWLNAAFIVQPKKRASSVTELEQHLVDWLSSHGLQPVPHPPSIVPPAPAAPSEARASQDEDDTMAETAYMPKAGAIQEPGQGSLFDDEDDEDVKTVRVDSKKAMEALGFGGKQQAAGPSVVRPGTTRSEDLLRKTAPHGAAHYLDDDDEEFDDDDDDDQMKTAVFAPSVARDLLRDLDSELSSDDDDDEDEGETQVMHVVDMSLKLSDQIKSLTHNRPPPGLSPSKPNVVSAEEPGMDAASALLQGHAAAIAKSMEPAQEATTTPAEIPFEQRPEVDEPAVQVPEPQPPMIPVSPPPRVPQAAIATQQLDAYRPTKRRVRWPIWFALFLIGGLISFFVTVHFFGFEGRLKTVWHRWTQHLSARSTAPVAPAASPSSSAPPSPSASTRATQPSSSRDAAGPAVDGGSLSDASSADATGPDAGDAKPKNVAACVETFFSGRAFAHRPDLSYLCQQTDLRKAADQLQLDIVKGGAGRISLAMKTWSSLGWYELMLVSVLQNQCCQHAPEPKLPSTGASCASLGQSIKELSDGLCKSSKTHEVAEKYRQSVFCLYANRVPRPYRYTKRPNVSQRAAFESLISTGCKNLAK